MTEISPIVWLLMFFWLFMIALMGIVLYVKFKKSKPIRKRKNFKLIKGENVE